MIHFPANFSVKYVTDFGTTKYEVVRPRFEPETGDQWRTPTAAARQFFIFIHIFFNRSKKIYLRSEKDERKNEGIQRAARGEVYRSEEDASLAVFTEGLPRMKVNVAGIEL